jgi:hypothetical protein
MKLTNKITKTVSKERLKGRKDILEYLMTAFCKCELPETTRIHLSNMLYAVENQING